MTKPSCPPACGLLEKLSRPRACVAAAVLGLFGPQAAARAAAPFWNCDGSAAVRHRFVGDEPVVLCMQGRRVVMQVEATPAGLASKVRFFQVLDDPGKRRPAWVECGPAVVPSLEVDQQAWPTPKVAAVTFDGMLRVVYQNHHGIELTRTIYPSMRQACVVEDWSLRNAGPAAVRVAVAAGTRGLTAEEGKLTATWRCPAVPAAMLAAGDTVAFSCSLQAHATGHAVPDVKPAAERQARQQLVAAAWRGPGRLETPEPLLDAAFALQKLHVLECPVDTIHGTITHNGSLTYAPGVWANDPVEYSSPLFPWLGDEELNRAAINMYRIWLRHCREHGIVPFPGSFEGQRLALVQKERGDDAMVLYGLTKFLLFLGERKAADELWPLVEMSAESVARHTTPDGIVASQSDEMEGRYPTGTANLSTSALAYGGYVQAAHAARALGKPAQAADFDRRAAALRRAIDTYFGAEVEGYPTYRYYQGNKTLRGWILLPLAMGITERQDATVAALTSDRLWPNKKDGADLLAESTRPTEWGRETYYALRVLFKAGKTDEALDLTKRVVAAQIFGPRGPYPDEDAIDMLCPGSLYPRVFTEGMFGIVPTGFGSFECTPRLPAGWPRMALRDVRAFGRAWDIVVERAGDDAKTTVTSGGKVVFSATGPAGTRHVVKWNANGN